jgi:hypothetical protein
MKTRSEERKLEGRLDAGQRSASLFSHDAMTSFTRTSRIHKSS